MSDVLISNEKSALLNLRRLPACLDVRQVAVLIGCHPDHIPVFVSEGLLTPLGRPQRNGVKLFAAREVERLMTEEKSLHKAQRCIQEYYRKRNSKTTSPAEREVAVSA